MPPKLFVAIPNYRQSVSGEFLDSVAPLMTHLGRRFGPGELQYMRLGQLFIDIARNMVWEAARQSGTENLLFIDDDMIFTPQTFETLWNTDAEIVSALYFIRREPPTAPCMYTRVRSGSYHPIISYKQNDVMEVDAVGFGFVLIRKPVLDALEAPFTRNATKGEDVVFCEHAREAGFKVRVNTAAKAGHAWMRPMVIDESNAGGEYGKVYGA